MNDAGLFVIVVALQFDSFFSDFGPVKWSFLVAEKGKKDAHMGMGYVQL